MVSIGKITRDDSVMFTNNTDKRTGELLDEYEIIENGNCYVDQLLENLIGNAEVGFDPYWLGDYTVEIPFVNARMCNGRLNGLQTLHRTGDCFLTKTFRRLHIAAEIGASDITIVYEITIKMKYVTLKFTINLHFGQIQIVTHFSIFANSGRDADMYQFQIENIRDLVPSIVVYKPLDWLLNKIVQATVWVFSSPIKRTLSNVIKRLIKDGLSSYQFPIVIDRTSPTYYEPYCSSETARNSRDNGLSSQDGSVESLTDSEDLSTVELENSSDTVFLSTLDQFRRCKSSCEERITGAITPELAFQLANEEFRRRKPSYEIL